MSWARGDAAIGKYVAVPTEEDPFEATTHSPVSRSDRDRAIGAVLHLRPVLVPRRSREARLPRRVPSEPAAP